MTDMALLESGMACEEWEGLTVDGRFPLLEWLGGWADRCVFLTVRQSTHTANIKLIQASGADADSYVARWNAAKVLPHSCLVQMMELGRYQLNGTDLAYVVTEKADTFLSGIVPRKAVDATSLTEILLPVVDALAFIHESGFVHASVKPSSIALIDGDWKLSPDEMSSTQEPLKSTRELDTYDAPELGSGALTTAADLWSLGIIVVEACSQRTPVWNRNAAGDLGVPDWLPAPFQEIARGCLKWDPAARITAARVKELLEQTPAANRDVVPGRPVEPAAVVEANVPTLSDRVAEVRAATVIEEIHSPFVRKPTETEPADLLPRSRLFTNIDEEEEQESSKGPMILALIVVLAVAAVIGLRYKDRLWPLISKQSATVASQPSQQSDSSQNQAVAHNTASPAAENQAPQTAVPQGQDATASGDGQLKQPVQPPGEANAPPTQETTAPATSPATGSAAAPVNAPPAAVNPSQQEKTETKSAPEHPPEHEERAQPARVMNASGSIVKRVMPNVAPGAMQSMRRPLQVDVRVSVNKNGAVSSAECMTQGPGNYFARISQQAARSWRFKPPVTNGEARDSEWMLLFQYTRGRTDVITRELH